MMDKLNGCIFLIEDKDLKLKSHNDEVTDFCNKEIPKTDSNHTYLAVTNLDSALKKDENY